MLSVFLALLTSLRKCHDDNFYVVIRQSLVVGYVLAAATAAAADSGGGAVEQMKSTSSRFSDVHASSPTDVLLLVRCRRNAPRTAAVCCSMCVSLHGCQAGRSSV